jgi:hypothetical protein
MGLDMMKKVTVRKNNLIEFEDQALGPGRHRFFGGVQAPDGGSVMLSPEREYGIFPTEEVYESIEAYLDGNLHFCMTELAQCGAVILRMMEFVQKEIGKKARGEK